MVVRRRRRRRALGALFLLTVLAVGGYLGLQAWLRSEAGRAYVKAEALAAVGGLLAGKVEARDVTLSPNGHLVLEGLKLFTPEGELVAEIARVEADVELAALARNALRLDQVRVDAPRLYLSSDERGLNLARAVAGKTPRAAAPTDGQRPWRVEVSAAEVSQGFFDFQKQSGRITVEQAHLSGSLALRLQPLELDTDFALDAHVTAPLDDTLAVRASAGAARGPQGYLLTAALGGSRLRARLEMPAGALTVEELVAAPREVAAFFPAWPLRVPVLGRGTASLSATRLELSTGAGALTLAAAYELPRRAVSTFSVTGRDLDPKELVGAELPSRLAFLAKGRVDDWAGDTLTGALDADATWTAQGQRLAAASIAATAKSGALHVARLTADTPGAALHTTGALSRSALQLSGTLDAKSLAQVSQTLARFGGVDTAGLRGRGTLALVVTGTPARPAVKTVGRLFDFGVAGAAAERIDANLDVPDVFHPLDTDVFLHATRLSLGGRAFDEVTLDFVTHGRELDLDVTTKGLGDTTLHLVGALDTDTTGASLGALEVSAAGSRWVMEAPSHVTWGDRFVLEPLVLREGERTIFARARVERRAIDAQLTLDRFDLGRLPRAFAPAALELGGLLDCDVKVGGTTARPTVEGKATLAQGQVWGFTGLDLEVDGRWREERAVGTARLASPTGRVEASLDVPVLALLDEKPAPTSAKVQVSGVDLAALEPRLGRSLPVAGVLEGSLELSGSAEAPVLRVLLEAPRLDVDLDAQPMVVPRTGPARRGGKGLGADGLPRLGAAAAPTPGAPPHRVLRFQRPRLEVTTTAAHTLEGALSTSSFGGSATLRLATGLTLASLRREVPGLVAALALPVALSVDVKGVQLKALHDERLLDDDELTGALAVTGQLTGSVKAPRGTLTAAVTSGGLPPLKAVDTSVTLGLAPDAISLAGTLAAYGKQAVTLSARLAQRPDPVVEAALEPTRRPDALDLLGAAPLEATATLAPVSLADLFPARDGKRAPGGTANATVELAGTLDAPRARLFGSLQGLAFDRLALGSARFDLRSTGTQQDVTVALGGQGRDDLKVKGTLGLDLRLSSLRRGLDWKTAGVDLTAVARSFDLGFLSGATDTLRAVAGRLSLEGEVKRTLGNPAFKGDVSLTGGRVALSGTGDYRDVELSLHVTNDVLDLSWLKAQSAGGTAELRVRAERRPTGDFRFEGHAKTLKFPVVSDDQLLALTTLESTFEGDGSPVELNVTRLSIPRVEVLLPEVKRRDLQDLQRPKDIIVLRGGRRPTQRLRALVQEEVAADAEAEASSRRFSARALVDAPRNLWVKGSDVNVELGLSEGFRVEYANGLQLFGEANLLRGELQVIGRKFAVQKGSQARFGGVASKPWVNVTALHWNEREKVKVTVTVAGKGSDVGIKPTSEPAMPESEIYTLLATGRRSLQKKGGAAITPGEAASVIGQFAASKVRAVLAKKLPLDVLDFEASDDFTRMKVDVGWYLSDQLYLGGSAQTGADRSRGENVVQGRLEYQVTRTISLEAYAGDASFGADAVWSRDF